MHLTTGGRGRGRAGVQGGIGTHIAIHPSFEDPVTAEGGVPVRTRQVVGTENGYNKGMCRRQMARVRLCVYGAPPSRVRECVDATKGPLAADAMSWKRQPHFERRRWAVDLADKENEALTRRPGT